MKNLIPNPCNATGYSFIQCNAMPETVITNIIFGDNLNAYCEQYKSPKCPQKQFLLDEHRFILLCSLFNSKKKGNVLKLWILFPSDQTAFLVFTIVDSVLCKFIERLRHLLWIAKLKLVLLMLLLLLFLSYSILSFILTFAMDPTSIFVFFLLLFFMSHIFLTPLFALIRIVKL